MNLRTGLKVIGLAIFLFANDSMAGSGSHPLYRISGFQILRTGEIEKSFSEAGPGVGGELALTTDGQYLLGYVKGRLTSQSGTQSFLDGVVSTSASFSYIQAGLEGGGLLYPIPRKNEGINLYVGGGASLGYNYLAIDKTVTFTSLTNNSQAMSFGYSALMGGEWFPTKNKWSVFAEFSYRVEAAALVDVSQFNLGGLLTSFGFCW
jgi:hypothetical protein